MRLNSRRIVILTPVALLLAVLGRFIWALAAVHRFNATMDYEWDVYHQPLGLGNDGPHKLSATYVRLCNAIGGYGSALQEHVPPYTFEVAFENVEFFGGVIKSVRGDLGRELLRFPEMKRVYLYYGSDIGSDSDQWPRLMAAFRKMPALAYLDIENKEFTTALLSELAGAPKLVELRLHYREISRDSLPAFQSLPQLKRLWFFDENRHGNESRKEFTDQIAAGLPNVEVFYMGRE